MTRRRLVASTLTLAVGVLLAGAPAAAAADTVVERSVGDGERLEIRNYKGTVRVVAWERDRLRVEADHSPDDEILVERDGSTWLVVPSSWERDSGHFALRLPDMARVRVEGEEPQTADIVVSMPSWMALVVESPHGDVVVEGAAGPVDVTTMLGDVIVDGGGTPMRLRSMIGRIELRGARGRTTLEGTRGKITVRDSAGELRVETTTGDVLLENLETVDVEVTTIDGDIDLRGPLTRDGQYDLSTHSGDVGLSLAGPVDARFSVRALRGGFDTDLPIDTPPEDGRGDFTLGRGSARIHLESFSGRIRLSRADQAANR